MKKITNFPIMFFASTMGFAGFTIAFRRLNLMFEISNLAFLVLKYFVTTLFVIITFLYIIKICLNLEGFKKEFSHPVKINFFAAFVISLLLIATVWEYGLVHYLFYYSGTFLLTFLTLYTISFWIKNQIKLDNLNPAWFIPIVGNLIVVLASNQKALYLWYYFSVGMFFYVVLFAIIFYRVVFYDALNQKFTPTYFILLAPPAIAFLGYTKLIGEYDAFSYFLLSLTLFFLFLIIFMFKNFLKLNFYLSWWAFTFPLAAITLAFFKAANLDKFFLYMGIFSFIALSLSILIVTFFTISAIIKGKICIEK
ncbi:MAG: SLAC1 anion channel family protein [Campylobacter sp.]|nr:SLAC1 anion channel family protein [Campylobacter sp.]